MKTTDTFIASKFSQPHRAAQAEKSGGFMPSKSLIIIRKSAAGVKFDTECYNGDA